MRWEVVGLRRSLLLLACVASIVCVPTVKTLHAHSMRVWHASPREERISCMIETAGLGAPLACHNGVSCPNGEVAIFADHSVNSPEERISCMNEPAG